MAITKTLHEKVREKLLASAKVTGFVAERVFAYRGPYGAELPAVYVEVSGYEPQEFTGLNCVWTGTQRRRLTLHCVGRDLGQAERLREAAQDALNGWFDIATEEQIHGAVPDGGQDGFENDGGAGQGGAFVCTREFSVTTHRSTA